MTIDEAITQAGEQLDRLRDDLRRRFLTSMLTDYARDVGEMPDLDDVDALLAWSDTEYAEWRELCLANLRRELIAFARSHGARPLI